MSLMAMTDRVFKRDGILCQMGKEYRAEQHRYARNVVCWLEGDQQPVALLEGETGIGKSLAYLIPLVIHLAITGKRALISTHTVHLIHQLNSDYELIYDVMEKLELPMIRFASRLGLQQYASPYSIRAAAKITTDEKISQSLSEWAGRIDAVYGVHVYAKWWTENHGSLPDGLPPLNIHESCPEEDMKWYRADCDKSMTADLVFTSHTVVALISKGLPLFGAAERPFSYIIADEADQLNDVAESVSQLRVRPSLLSKSLSEIKWPNPKLIEPAAAQLANMQDFLDQVSDDYPDQDYCLLEMMPAHIQIEFAKHAKKLSKLLPPLLETAIETGASRPSIQKMKDFCDGISNMASPAGANRCISWSPVLRKGSIASGDPFAGLSISRWVRGFDEEHQPAVRMMLTSATLSISRKQGLERYNNVRSTLGLKRSQIGLYDKHSPSHFGDISFVLADPEQSPPFQKDEDDGSEYSPEWLTYAVSMLRRCTESGETLCLCPSYREVKELAAYNQPNVGFHLPGTTLIELVEQLQAGEIQAVVTPAAWEGVSIRKADGSQLLRNVMVTRMPFAPPSKSTEAVFVTAYQQHGYSPKQAMAAMFSKSHDAAMRKFKQGLIGRGIRANNDNVTAWVADPRIGPEQRYKLSGLIPDRFQKHYNEPHRFILDANGGHCAEPETESKLGVVAWI